MFLINGYNMDQWQYLEKLRKSLNKDISSVRGMSIAFFIILLAIITIQTIVIVRMINKTK